MVYRGRLEPITGMAAGLGAVVLLGPVVHPWYVLWGLIPLAATRALPRYRRALLAASAVLAVVVPPTGADFNFRAFQLPLALVATLVMLAVLVLLAAQRIQGAARCRHRRPARARAVGVEVATAVATCECALR